MQMQSDKGSKKTPKAGKGASARAAEPAKKPEAVAKGRSTRAVAKKAEPVEKVSAQHMHAPAAKFPKPTVVPAESSERKAVRQEDIAALAHSYWVEREHSHGSHEEDWLRAERELAAQD